MPFLHALRTFPGMNWATLKHNKFLIILVPSLTFPIGMVGYNTIVYMAKHPEITFDKTKSDKWEIHNRLYPATRWRKFLGLDWTRSMRFNKAKPLPAPHIESADYRKKLDGEY